MRSWTGVRVAIPSALRGLALGVSLERNSSSRPLRWLLLLLLLLLLRPPLPPPKGREDKRRSDSLICPMDDEAKRERDVSSGAVLRGRVCRGRAGVVPGGTDGRGAGVWPCSDIFCVEER